MNEPITAVPLVCSMCGADFTALVPVAALQDEAAREKCPTVRTPICPNCNARIEAYNVQ